jgi:hypothetical protein
MPAGGRHVTEEVIAAPSGPPSPESVVDAEPNPEVVVPVVLPADETGVDVAQDARHRNPLPTALGVAAVLTIGLLMPDVLASLQPRVIRRPLPKLACLRFLREEAEGDGRDA